METILVIAVIGIIIYLYDKKDSSSSNQSRVNNSYPTSQITEREFRRFLLSTFEGEVIKVINQNKSNGPIVMGYAIEAIISNLFRSFNNESSQIASELKLPVSKVRMVIEDVTIETRRTFLENV